MLIPADYGSERGFIQGLDEAVRRTWLAVNSNNKMQKRVDMRRRVWYLIEVANKAEYPLSPWRKGDPGL